MGSGYPQIAMRSVTFLLLQLATASALSFSKAHGDHMVLQQAPQRAVVWGFGTPGATVEVRSTAFADVVQTSVAAEGTWKATLPPVVGSKTSHSITAVSQSEQIQLQDVLFGDVWVCSGQSNMQMTVRSCLNATEEIAAAQNYPFIRVMTVALIESLEPQPDFPGITQAWSVADPQSIGGPEYGFFSASCWFFGRTVYETVDYPIGLVSTSWGGTYIQAWSSPDALEQCPGSTSIPPAPVDPVVTPKANPNQPSVLWNSMVIPLLRTTIRGALWYQGESNSGSFESSLLYGCQFPAMIADWREKWQAASGQTDPEFPFGFVQLSTWGTDQNYAGSVPVLRWTQSAGYGFVPNLAMPKTFMAVAVDLGDPTGDIHPPDKQNVGFRLARGALNIAYGKDISWTGPLINTVVADAQPDTFIASFVNTGTQLVLRNGNGFELCGGSDQCTAGCSTCRWVNATVVDNTANTITLKAIESGNWKALRYNWRQSPCSPDAGRFQCAVYCSCDLPTPPFFAAISGANGESTVDSNRSRTH